MQQPLTAYSHRVIFWSNDTGATLSPQALCHLGWVLSYFSDCSFSFCFNGVFTGPTLDPSLYYGTFCSQLLNSCLIQLMLLGGARGLWLPQFTDLQLAAGRGSVRAVKND